MLRWRVLARMFFAQVVLATMATSSTAEVNATTSSAEETSSARDSNGGGTSESASETEARPSEKKQSDSDDERRADMLRERRLEQLEELQPETLTRTERLLRWLEGEIGEPGPETSLRDVDQTLQLDTDSTDDVGILDYRNRVFPRIGSLRAGGGLATGIRWFRRDLITGLDADAVAAVSVNGYGFYRVRFGRMSVMRMPEDLRGTALPARPNPFFAFADVRYGDFRDEDFYGLGGDSSLEDETTFRRQRASYSGIVGYRLNPNVTLSGRAGFSQMRIGEGASNPLPAVGPSGVIRPDRLDQDGDFFETAASFIADYRDAPGAPHEGIAASLSVARFDDTETNRFAFNRYSAEVQGYVPLFSAQRTLALIFLISSDVADAGGEVPFYLQRTLGSSNTLRGFDNFRFRGTNLLHLTAEYRWEPALYWELAVFWDGGKVFEDFDEGFHLRDLENSIGFGTRFKTESSVVLSFDVAFSRETTRFHVGVGTVF